MTTPGMPPPSDSDQAALAWFTRMRAIPGPGPQDQRAFAQWLAADPAHARSYAAVERTWEATAPAADRLAREEADDLAQLLAVMDAPRETEASANRRRPAARRCGRWWGWWWGRALAAAACLLLVLGGLWLERPFTLDGLLADHATAPGQRRTLSLTDGSTVELDADSAITVAMTGETRRVRLLRGRAFFAVSHDGRPFTVVTEDGQVHVLGTRFGVDRTAGATLVAVEEGRVGVFSGGTESDLVLTPGEQARLTGGDPPATRVETASPLAWRQGRLIFHDAPLSRIAATLSRYSDGRVLVLAPGLADRTVSGTFPADAPRDAIDALQSVLGFHQIQVGLHVFLLP